MYLLCRHIKQTTDFKVILSGEGADELFGGYLYFHGAPNDNEFHNETCRLLQDIHLYDGLRADRCSAGNGLEIRVPFLDKSFVNYVLTLENNANKCEKYILRNAFEGKNIIPDEILWRKKDAFSDAVGYNWIDYLKQHANEAVETCDASTIEWSIPTLSKEEYLYKSIFLRHYGCWKRHNYMWRPRWTSVTEPSATYLRYHQNNS